MARISTDLPRELDEEGACRQSLLAAGGGSLAAVAIALASGSWLLTAPVIAAAVLVSYLTALRIGVQTPAAPLLLAALTAAPAVALGVLMALGLRAGGGACFLGAGVLGAATHFGVHEGRRLAAAAPLLACPRCRYDLGPTASIPRCPECGFPERNDEGPPAAALLRPRLEEIRHPWRRAVEDAPQRLQG